MNSAESNAEREIQNADSTILNKARNDLIFNAQGPAIAVVFLVIIGFAYAAFGEVSNIVLFSWVALCLGSYFVRYSICVVYQKSDDASQGSARWQTRFSVASCLSGLIWGGAAFFLVPKGAGQLELTLILIIVFLASATTVTHSAYKWASLGFSVCSLVPTAISLYLSDSPGHTALGSIVLGFGIVMGSSSLYLERIANRMFLLSHTNACLVADLKNKNHELEDYNRKLEETKAELSHANDNLQNLLTTDALTGLTNRRRFDALAKVKWLRCAEQRRPIAIVIVNIDHFKKFNDFYGHRKGDGALLTIASHMQQMPEINRKGDCIARYSGDEFAVLLLDADETYAREVGEKIRKVVEMLRIPCSEMPGGVSPWLSVSVGSATEQDYSGNSIEDLFEMTDKAMYMAKRAGRNKVYVHEHNRGTNSGGAPDDDFVGVAS